MNGRQVLYVDLRDGLSHPLLAGSPWRGVPWERDEQEVMRRFVQPGDIVLDVGAHVGLHLVLLAELVGPTGHVHAFEPNPRKIRTLAATVARLPNATLHAVALADQCAAATLFVPEDESMASLSDWTAGRVGLVSRSACHVERLDDLIEAGRVPQPVFVKCDVEGSEFRVLSGGRRALEREDAPVVLYEANARSARAFGLPVSAATEFLRSLRAPRYSIYHVQGGARLRRIEDFDPACDHFNLVAVPASKAFRISGDPTA